MALTDDDLHWLRSKIGTKQPPTDADLNDAFDRLGTKEAVAQEVLDTRLADLLNAPAQFTVVGEYSEDRSSNIKGMQDAVKDADSGFGAVTQSFPCPPIVR